MHSSLGEDTRGAHTCAAERSEVHCSGEIKPRKIKVVIVSLGSPGPKGITSGTKAGEREGEDKGWMWGMTRVRGATNNPADLMNGEEV